MRLYDLIKDLIEILQDEANIRDQLVKASRDIIKMSKDVVINVHRENFKLAEEILREMSIRVSEFTKLARKYDVLYTSGIVRDTLGEYVEAFLYFSLMRDGKFRLPLDKDIPPQAYILGILDVMGELRRKLLDYLRSFKIHEAEQLIEYMEVIYEDLCLLNLQDAIIPGYRRKCDIARQILEKSKSDLIYVKCSLNILKGVSSVEEK